MKMVSHGNSVTRLMIAPEIAQVVRDSGLDQLVRVSYGVIDKGLIEAFVERWQPETSSFHLPIGEMTITLDDVSQLLHLPVRGNFWTAPYITSESALEYLVNFLGVDPKDAADELTVNKGPSVRLKWLANEVYPALCSEGKWVEAARAFLLHLVGATLFADKSATRTKVAYLSMFLDLGAAGSYSWGAMALAYMYDQLREASRASTKQIAGYLTLFQVYFYPSFTGKCMFMKNKF